MTKDALEILKAKLKADPELRAAYDKEKQTYWKFGMEARFCYRPESIDLINPRHWESPEIYEDSWVQ